MLKPALAVMLLLTCTSPSWAGAAASHDPELRKALLEAVSSADSFYDRFEAEVWLLDMSNRLESSFFRRFIPDQQERMEFLRLVHQESTRAKLPPEMVLALIQVESAFQRFAISRVGARGYMQIMPFWKKEIGRPDDNLMHAPTNLRYGCTILRHYLNREKGNWVRALARYNGSLGRTVYPDKVMTAWQKNWFVNY